MLGFCHVKGFIFKKTLSLRIYEAQSLHRSAAGDVSVFIKGRFISCRHQSVETKDRKALCVRACNLNSSVESEFPLSTKMLACVSLTKRQ